MTVNKKSKIYTMIWTIKYGVSQWKWLTTHWYFSFKYSNKIAPKYRHIKMIKQ